MLKPEPTPAHSDSRSPAETTLSTLAAIIICLVVLLLSSCAKQQVTTLSSAENRATRAALEAFYSNWQGVPYRMGGMSHSAIDCSGLAVIAYRDLFDLQLPRTTAEQADYGKKISRRALQPGDLVFFKTGFFQRHVGIYLEQSTFIHASTSKGVMLSRLDEPYWQDNYWKAVRVMGL